MVEASASASLQFVEAVETRMELLSGFNLKGSNMY